MIEDLQWVLREITAGGGDGSICEARFIDGLAEDRFRRRAATTTRAATTRAGKEPM